MSSLGVCRLYGKSGTMYPFDIYKLDAEKQSVSVVYAVSKLVHNAGNGYQYQIIYIGETDDLKARFSGHHKQSCFDRNGADRLLLLLEESQSRRRFIESDLIKYYDTPCND